MKKGLDFFREIRYNIEAVRIRRGILIGKEPHWKCGVPQGIVRSSRILSAMPEQRELCSGFFVFAGDGFPREVYFFLADSAVLRYDKRKATNEREGAVSRKLRCT